MEYIKKSIADDVRNMVKDYLEETRENFTNLLSAPSRGEVDNLEDYNREVWSTFGAFDGIEKALDILDKHLFNDIEWIGPESDVGKKEAGDD